MILRFMGDLPEPKAPTAAPEVKEHGSLAKRLKGTIGRKLSSTNKPGDFAAEVGVPLVSIPIYQPLHVSTLYYTVSMALDKPTIITHNSKT